ncbi:MAG: hypothetical protein CMA00_003335 [Methanobacteriota archaeon]|nr:MAG: hypothetical protein CMA00_003335 [Euryarchaeota archaeon]
MSEEELPDWVVSTEEGGDDFSKIDTDGDGKISREEFEAAMGKAPLLTGDVNALKEAAGNQGESLFQPLDEIKKPMNSNLQFFLGTIVYPIGVLILAWLFSGIFYATGSYELGDLASFGVVGIGYVGGAAWGFSSGHSSFAWGVLASLIILPGLMFGLLFGFCMLMISTGNGL